MYLFENQRRGIFLIDYDLFAEIYYLYIYLGIREEGGPCSHVRGTIPPDQVSIVSERDLFQTQAIQLSFP